MLCEFEFALLTQFSFCSSLFPGWQVLEAKISSEETLWTAANSKDAPQVLTCFGRVLEYGVYSCVMNKQIILLCLWRTNMALLNFGFAGTELDKDKLRSKSCTIINVVILYLKLALLIWSFSVHISYPWNAVWLLQLSIMKPGGFCGNIKFSCGGFCSFLET